MATRAATVDLLLKIGSDTGGIRTVVRELDRFSGQLRAGFNLNLGGGIAGLLTSLPSRAIAATNQLTRENEQLAREIERGRNQLKLSAEGYQVFSAVLKASNSDVSALGPAMGSLSRNIGEFALGSETAADKFRPLMLRLADLQGLAPERQMETLAKALARVTDENVRDALAADLLGRNYAQLKPLLEALAKQSLPELTESVRNSSGLLSGEMSRSIDDLATRSEQAGSRIAKGFAPVTSLFSKLKLEVKETIASMVAPKTIPAGASDAAITRNFAREQTFGKTIGELEGMVAAQQKIYDELARRVSTLGPATSEELLQNYRRTLIILEEMEAQLSRARQAAGLKTAEEEKISDAMSADAKRRRNEARRIDQLQFEQRLANDLAAVRIKVDQAEETQAAQARERAQALIASQVAKNETEISRLQNNRFLTQAQKSELLIPLLQKENALIAERIRLYNLELKSNPNLSNEAKLSIQQRIDGLNRDRANNAGQIDGTRTLGFGEQLRADFVRLQDTIGTVSQQVSGFLVGTVQSAISGVSSGIYGLITGTQTWGQAFLNVGAIILQSLIQFGVQMGVNHLLGQALATKASAAQVGRNAAIAASAAPAAAAVSISTGGAAAVTGSAATISGISAVVAAMSSFAAFADGGHVRGPGSGTSDSILARLSNDEHIIRASVARRLRPQLDYINRTGEMPRFADGGAVRSLGASIGSSLAAAGGGGSAPVNVRAVWVPDRHYLQRMIRENSRDVIVEILRAEGY